MNFTIYPKADVKKNKNSGTFQSMGLSCSTLKGITQCGYKIPTPIQRKAIPEILLGKDVVAMARTGSGKTAAFLIPMLERLNKSTDKKGLRGLIMAPTRELALQTYQFTRKLGKFSDLNVAIILGGDKIEEQFQTLHDNPDIVIATPGRFLHIIIEMNLSINSVEYVVFDEADRLFEMGFKEQLNEILRKLPTENRQTLLFSATLPQTLVEFVSAGLQNPLLIRLDLEMKLSENLKLDYFQCRNEDKIAFLIHLLEFIVKAEKDPSKLDPLMNKEEPIQQTLIFVATKHHVEYVKSILEEIGYKISYVYSDLDQTARKINIAKFQNKKTSIMIVTDVAARGIDIPLLKNVVNFNFPAKAKLFVHRVGRCARAGESGNAYSFISTDEIPYLLELHDFICRPINFNSQNENKETTQSNCVYGTIPQAIIDNAKEILESVIKSKFEIISLKKVQDNAYKHYIKCRPPTQSNFVKIAKNEVLGNQALKNHPLLDTFIIESNIAVRMLQNYRVKSTIFEVNKTKNTQRNSKIMQKKRERVDNIMKKEKNRKRTETKYDNNLNENVTVSDFKDNNFISYKPNNFNREKELGINSFLKDASHVSVDLIADDDKEIIKAGQKRKWDRKKKKFVNENDNAKKLKTESGHYINASYKSNLYSKWLKRSGTLDKNENDQTEEHQTDGRKENVKKGKYFKSKTQVDNKRNGKPRRSELRTRDQIMKSRGTKKRFLNKK